MCLIDIMINCLLDGYFEDKLKYIYKGCFIFNDEVYVFLDFTNNIPKSGLNVRLGRAWFVLPDEIMNKQHACNILISDEVETFFIHNTSFLFLHESDNVLDTPIVVYSGAHDKKSMFSIYVWKNKNK